MRSPRPPDRLMAGARDERERRVRRRLLRDLADAGVAEGELQAAVEQDRLPLLPAELALAGPDRSSFSAVARRAGVDPGFLAAFLRASGLPVPERATAADLSAARRLRQLLDAGLPEEAILDTTRVVGQGIASSARAIHGLAGRTLLRAGDSELDVGRRFADAARELLPSMGRLMEYQLRLHLREALRHEAVSRAVRESGTPAHSREVAVAFADLVGFTRLGTRIHAAEIGRVAGRLLELAYEIVDPPVTVVKTIGDALMLVSPDAGALIEDLLLLVAAVDGEGEDFPQLRAGVAYGMAVPMGGDWYGEAVNLASRLTEVARRGTVLAAAPARRQARDRFSWSRSLPRHFKGIAGAMSTFRPRLDPPKNRHASRTAPADAGDRAGPPEPGGREARSAPT